MDTLTRTAIEIPSPTIVVLEVIEDEDPFWLWTSERLDEVA
jgi:hypothetical protein